MSKQECIHGFTEGCIRCAISDSEYKTPVTLVALVVDASTSMRNRLQQTLSGLNEYIDGLRGHDNIQYLLSLTTFSYSPRLVINSLPLQEVPKIEQQHYVVGGNTALYDAVGETIQTSKAELEKYPGASVLFVVLTDGEENASHKYDRAGLSPLIAEQQKTGNWTFAFIGCDIENWEDAKVMAVPQGNTLGVKGSSYGAAFDTLRGSTLRYAQGRSASFMRATAEGQSRSEMAFSVNKLFDEVTDPNVDPAPKNEPLKK